MRPSCICQCAVIEVLFYRIFNDRVCFCTGFCLDCRRTNSFFDLAVKLPFSSALSSMESWRICGARRFMKRNGEAPSLPEMSGWRPPRVTFAIFLIISKLISKVLPLAFGRLLQFCSSCSSALNRLARVCRLFCADCSGSSLAGVLNGLLLNGKSHGLLWRRMQQIAGGATKTNTHFELSDHKGKTFCVLEEDANVKHATR